MSRNVSAGRILLLALLVAGVGLAGSAQAIPGSAIETNYWQTRIHHVGCDFEAILYGWNGSDCPGSSDP